MMPAAIQPGELGTINLKKDDAGVWRARARYRDLSGRIRWLRGEGDSRKRAADGPSTSIRGGAGER